MSPLRAKDERTAEEAYLDAGATIEALRRENAKLRKFVDLTMVLCNAAPQECFSLASGLKQLADALKG